MPTDIIGYEAHDAVASGAPVRVAGTARTTSPTAVSSGDVAQVMTDTLGKQISLPYANPENFTSGKTAAITGTADTPVIAAPGAGVRLYITTLVIANSHATVNTEVVIKDGATELMRVFANSIAGTSGPASIVITLPVPLRLTANTALNAANITTASNTYVAAVGYTAP